MQMNSGIILAGTQPDFVNVLRQSNAGAQEANQTRQQNALRNLYQTQGAEIAAGDPNALNALARFDPKAALGIQGDRQGLEAGALGMDATRLGMDATRQRMDVLSAQEKRAVQEQAARMSAAERAQQQQQIQQGLMQGIQLHQAGDLPRLNALLQSVGEQPIQSLDQFPSVAVKYQGVLEALSSVEEFNQGPEAPASIQALRIRAQEAGMQPGTPEYAEFMARGGKTDDGMRITQSADGGLVFEQGAAVSGQPKKLTERQSQLTLFGSMMDKTMPVINDLETKFDPANLRDNAAARAGWTGNFFKSQEMQKYETAGRAWAEGVLRLQTGAAATQPEIERVFETYFAQPGDTPETVQYKREIRSSFAESVGLASGGLVTPGSEVDPNSGAATESVQGGEFTFQNDEQRSVFEKYSQP